MLTVSRSLLDLNRRGLLLDKDLRRLLDEAARQAPMISELRRVDRVAEEEGAEAAFVYFTRLREAGIESVFGLRLDRLEYASNARGYQLMAAGELDRAREVFTLATLVAPESANAWDSLGECSMRMDRLDGALRQYRKSLDLNPDNRNAREMIERIQRNSSGPE